MQSGGLLVAATLKYADAVLKTLATSGSIGKPTVATDVIFALMCLYYLYVCVLYHVCVFMSVFLLIYFIFVSSLSPRVFFAPPYLLPAILTVLCSLFSLP